MLTEGEKVVLTEKQKQKIAQYGYANIYYPQMIGGFFIGFSILGIARNIRLQIKEQNAEKEQDYD